MIRALPITAVLIRTLRHPTLLACAAVSLVACAQGTVTGGPDTGTGTDATGGDTSVAQDTSMSNPDVGTVDTGSQCSPECPTGTACSDGVCICPTGQTLCGTTCTILMDDPANCGACGNACGANNACLMGTCRAVCNAPTTACPTAGDAGGDQCVDLQTSSTNCGSCGRACTSPATCTSGRCCSQSTYMLTTGLISGTQTICCHMGDTLQSVSDCGVGNNHSATQQNNCGVAAEGAMNNGSACASIVCQHTTCS